MYLEKLFHKYLTFETLTNKAMCYTQIICYHIKGVKRVPRDHPRVVFFYPQVPQGQNIALELYLITSHILFPFLTC